MSFKSDFFPHKSANTFKLELSVYFCPKKLRHVLIIIIVT